MNSSIAGIKKDLVPRIIVNGYNIYLGFVHETSKKPLKYYDFLSLNGSGTIEEDCVPYDKGDYIYPFTISSYFIINDRLMRKRGKYNLMKKKHEYNRRKYGKIRAKSNL